MKPGGWIRGNTGLGTLSAASVAPTSRFDLMPLANGRGTKLDMMVAVCDRTWLQMKVAISSWQMAGLELNDAVLEILVLNKIHRHAEC